MIDVVEQVIERHPKVKNEGIPETSSEMVLEAVALPLNRPKSSRPASSMQP